MSNPTELPDLEVLMKDLSMGWGRERRLRTMQAIRDLFARRAKPEGEAPQADLRMAIANLPLPAGSKERQHGFVDCKSAVLDLLTAAQHAESGALPITRSTYGSLEACEAERERRAALAAQSQGAQAAPGIERGTDYIMAAVASYADDRSAGTLERIRRMVAEGEQARAAQQAAAPGALKPDLMRQAVASVVSRSGNDLRIAWLRPERCDVGTLLYCSTEPAPSPSAPGTPEAPQTAAARDVLGERRRQIEVEGWTPERDDQYDGDELSRAAACYAMSIASENNYFKPLNFWPWDMAWWKPQGTRRNLVKAGALILADIERLDRAAQLDGGQGESHA